jgi:hypothetical protein
VRRSLALAVLLAAATCAGSGRSAREAAADRALERIARLAAAMKADDARRALAVGDPRDGIVFWGQPGAYPRPLFRARPGSGAPLSVQAERAGADAYYVEPTGYWQEVGAALERALAVARTDAGPYAVPPEEDLERAPPWGSLDTEGVRVGDRDYPSLAEEPETAALVRKQVQRYRFRAEVGRSSVTVFLTEQGVSHVILVWHYDA